MLRTLLYAFLLLPGIVLGESKRFDFNDRRVPDGLKDVRAIQDALVKALPRARAATVCIKIKDGTGTGVIVDKGGLILTAAHVSQGVNRRVTVIMQDGTEHRGKTLGLLSDTDAAMVRIEDPGEYPFVELDRDNTTKLGDWVFALGHSGGFDKPRGPVARLGRLVRIAGHTYQSDCTLIGGDSGGPLFDMNGVLVGIHSRVGAQLQSNLHVPLRVFFDGWEQMKKGEFVGDGPFAEENAKGGAFLGLATESRKGGGLDVLKVGKNTPAESAGLQEGDILFRFAGKAVNTRKELQDQLAEMRAWEEVEVEIEHKGEQKTLTIELGER